MPLHHRYGALKSWSNTVDRTARTEPARRRSPASIDRWLALLGTEFEHASDAQRLAAADAAKRAHFAQLAMKSAAVRRARKGSTDAA